MDEEEEEEEGNEDCLERTGTDSEFDLIFAVLTIFSHISSVDRLVESCARGCDLGDLLDVYGEDLFAVVSSLGGGGCVEEEVASGLETGSKASLDGLESVLSLYWASVCAKELVEPAEKARLEHAGPLKSTLPPCTNDNLPYATSPISSRPPFPN